MQNNYQDLYPYLEGNMLKTFTHRITTLMFAQAQALTFMLSLTALIMGLGFILGVTTSANYAGIVALGGDLVWAGAFIVFGLLKLIQAVFRIHYFVKIGNSLLGIWLWSFLFLTFSVIGKAELRPLELLLVIPILCEAWEITMTIFNFRLFQGRRESDLL